MPTRLSAYGQRLELVEAEDLTSGSERFYTAEFSFDTVWDGMERTAVFKTHCQTISVLLDNTNTCRIPWEVLEQGNVPLGVSVFGVRSGKIVLTTNYIPVGQIIKGADRDAAAGGEPTPGVYEQILERINGIPGLEEMKALKESIPDPMTADELRKILMNGGIENA